MGWSVGGCQSEWGEALAHFLLGLLFPVKGVMSGGCFDQLLECVCLPSTAICRVLKWTR